MDKEDKVIEERIPVGVVTMLLTGYLETNKRLTYALIVAIVALLCSWGGDFCIIFLSMRLKLRVTELLKTAE